MTIQEYIDAINRRYKLGNATEHTFRGDLQQLIESLVPAIRATNEPKRQTCGAPDYILTKKDIPIGFIEAKNIGDNDLEGIKRTGNKEQFDRYKASLNNLFFTDYIHFHLYREGQLVTKIAIAELQFPSTGGVSEGRGGRIVPLTKNFTSFENLIKDFCTYIGQTITKSKKLAEMMAGKARLLSEVIEKALTSDETHNENSTLKDQMNAFKQILIHDITPKGFADVYAQTITYGMFAARYHDPTLENFSRQEAYELIPKSNPFLKKLFGYIAGLDVDDRIKWVVDDLINIFLACNVEEMLKNYGKATKMEDPIIHFYEDFLSEYDPKLRKARGVWYTPAPVVNFIVRAVDDILKTEFDLPQGLADTSKINSPDLQGRVHKVQILDPATGTGTFLAEVVKHIHKKFVGQQGVWSNYVENHLLPRLNGFELLMASYAMAYLKLDMLLTDTGYKPTSNQRFRIFLTNSLEEHHPDTGTLFANWLSTEANEANHIKRDTPVMVVMGNPPYFGFKSNDGEWITKLTNDYKFVDGLNINEKKHRLGNDYVKFIRFGQFFIDKNKEGVLAYINDHGFLFNPTFKGMRWNLMNSFDEIYVLDLHGNSKKKEKSSDGTKDENVFDIQQGVSINIFIKTGKKKKNELAKVYYHELLGLREMKYDYLINNEFKEVRYEEIVPSSPFYFFLPNKLENIGSYELGFSVDEILITGVTGTVTGNDELLIGENKIELKNKLNELVDCEIDSKYIKSIEYRPFSKKAMYFIETFNKNPYSQITVPASYRSRYNVMKHLAMPNNYCLIVGRQGQVVGDMPWNIIFISNNVVDLNMFYRGGGVVSPLYLYPETNAQQTIGKTTERTPNLNAAIVKQIAEKLGLTFRNEKTSPTPPKEGLNSSPKGRLGGVGYITANPAHYNLIKEMRDSLKDNPTEAEKVIWEYLRNKKTGYKIRRQHIIEDFITDFVCLSKKVVIEIDGKVHLRQKEYDEIRTLRLHELGYEVIRFTNEEVFTNPELVALKTKEKLDSKSDLQINDLAVSPPLEGLGEVFTPIDILDYIYAVLHSPAYREKYKEFLKIDFPRVPYPKDTETFWQLVQWGGELRQIHLLESPVVENYITQYPVDGNNTVVKPHFVSTSHDRGRVYINDAQYFDNVPRLAWNFYIGGYQPAQKWLKDRKDRILAFDDILHYQKIIVALSETDRIMKEIDTIDSE